MGVGLRLRNPETPVGYRMDVWIQEDTLPKLLRVLDIVGGRVLKMERQDGSVRLLLEKTDAKDAKP